MGRNETAITSSEKNNGRPTSFAAVMIVSVRSANGFCSSRLCAFSTITIAASTMAPMAIAIPPRDMMFEVTFRYAIGMKDSRTATGRIRITTRALRR